MVFLIFLYSELFYHPDTYHINSQAHIQKYSIYPLRRVKLVAQRPASKIRRESRQIRRYKLATSWNLELFICRKICLRDQL